MSKINRLVKRSWMAVTSAVFRWCCFLDFLISSGIALGRSVLYLLVVNWVSFEWICQLGGGAVSVVEQVNNIVPISQEGIAESVEVDITAVVAHPISTKKYIFIAVEIG